MDPDIMIPAGAAVPLPADNSGIRPDASLIAGSVLPIKRAEELLQTLPGVISARIIASPSGPAEEVNILTTVEVGPKQTVRNVESALIAHLGMHVSHKKISVAISDERQSRFATPSMPKPAVTPTQTPSAAAPAVADRPVAVAQP